MYSLVHLPGFWYLLGGFGCIPGGFSYLPCGKFTTRSHPGKVLKIWHFPWWFKQSLAGYWDRVYQGGWGWIRSQNPRVITKSRKRKSFHRIYYFTSRYLRAETFARKNIREIFTFREHKLSRMGQKSFFWEHKISRITFFIKMFWEKIK